jgi:hypothetical protein
VQRCIRTIAFVTAWIAAYSLSPAADDAPKPAEPGTLVVIDANGKEQKLKSWKFGFGTRRLTWLAPAAPKEDKEAPKDKAKPGEKRVEPAGPVALEFRDEKLSTPFARGITYLIPLERIRSIDYDNDKRSVTIRVAVSEKPEED